MTNKFAMRDVLLQEIYDKMESGEQIVFVAADFGSPVLDKIRSDFPDRFFNVGIAEQNAVNITAGLALEGFTVCVYAISAFITMRCLEQIRVHMGLLGSLREMSVNIIGVGSGVSYDVSGPTHHCLEDISMLRSIPGIEIFSPSDWMLTKSYGSEKLTEKGVRYFRLDSKPHLPIDSDNSIENGFRELVTSQSCYILSAGTASYKALEIADSDSRVGVIDVFNLSEINEELLVSKLKGVNRVVTLEEGFAERGGFDSFIIFMLNRLCPDVRFKSFGFKNEYQFEIGSRDHLYKEYGVNQKEILRFLLDE